MKNGKLGLKLAVALLASVSCGVVSNFMGSSSSVHAMYCVGNFKMDDRMFMLTSYPFYPNDEFYSSKINKNVLYSQVNGFGDTSKFLDPFMKMLGRKCNFDIVLNQIFEVIYLMNSCFENIDEVMKSYDKEFVDGFIAKKRELIESIENSLKLQKEVLEKRKIQLAEHEKTFKEKLNDLLKIEEDRLFAEVDLESALKLKLEEAKKIAEQAKIVAEAAKKSVGKASENGLEEAEKIAKIKEDEAKEAGELVKKIQADLEAFQENRTLEAGLLCDLEGNLRKLKELKLEEVKKIAEQAKIVAEAAKKAVGKASENGLEEAEKIAKIKEDKAKEAMELVEKAQLELEEPQKEIGLFVQAEKREKLFEASVEEAKRKFENVRSEVKNIEENCRTQRLELEKAQKVLPEYKKFINSVKESKISEIEIETAKGIEKSEVENVVQRKVETSVIGKFGEQGLRDALEKLPGLIFDCYKLMQEEYDKFRAELRTKNMSEKKFTKNIKAFANVVFGMSSKINGVLRFGTKPSLYDLFTDSEKLEQVAPERKGLFKRLFGEEFAQRCKEEMERINNIDVRRVTYLKANFDEEYGGGLFAERIEKVLQKNENKLKNKPKKKIRFITKKRKYADS